MLSTRGASYQEQCGWALIRHSIPIALGLFWCWKPRNSDSTGREVSAEREWQRMSHPQVENATPFAFEPVFLADEEGRPILVPLVKATYSLSEKGLELAPKNEQVPPVLAGRPYGDPETSSFRYEPEGCLPKPATDVVLVGSAVAPRHGTTEMIVALQVGPLKKGVKVLGDRVFYKAITTCMTKPNRFERMPLQWERTFGGWDRSNPDPAKHQVEPRNPVGVGFHARGSKFEAGLLCPNIEDPLRPFRGWGDRPPPAGFGFVSPNWQPRAQYAGTCDTQWEAERAPLVPLDFDRRFLNAAAPGLTASGVRRSRSRRSCGRACTGGAGTRYPPGRQDLARRRGLVCRSLLPAMADGSASAQDP
jgi:hypothetical protein